MRKKRKFCGAPPIGEQWEPSGRYFNCDGADWTIYYSLRCIEDGYMNFKVFSLGSVKSKANYWLGMNGGRLYNRDVPLLELRTDLYCWAHKVMKGIYSDNVGRLDVSRQSRPVDVPGQPAQGQSALV